MNHFIEVNKDSKGNLYLVIHSGSRNLGSQIATYYQNRAYETLASNTKIDIDRMISKLKSEGREREISSEIEKYKGDYVEVSKELAYVHGQLFDDYIHDMKRAQYFASLNRLAMTFDIVEGLGLDIYEQFATIHNYIDTDSMILRKGAVSARKGEIFAIPINMRDGTLICKGKGNPEWNYSAPHGAGRIMSRAQAKETCSLDEFTKSMDGIYTTSVCEATLDESPFAYKDMEEIVNNIGDTAEIIGRLIPIYNFKAM